MLHNQFSCVQLLEDICLANNWGIPTYQMSICSSEGGVLYSFNVRIPLLPQVFSEEMLGSVGCDKNGVFSPKDFIAGMEESKEICAGRVISCLDTLSQNNLLDNQAIKNQDFTSTADSFSPASFAAGPQIEPCGATLNTQSLSYSLSRHYLGQNNTDAVAVNNNDFDFDNTSLLNGKEIIQNNSAANASNLISRVVSSPNSIDSNSLSATTMTGSNSIPSNNNNNHINTSSKLASVAGNNFNNGAVAATADLN